VPKKQRHTAKRIWELLQDDGFDGILDNRVTPPRFCSALYKKNFSMKNVLERRLSETSKLNSPKEDLLSTVPKAQFWGRNDETFNRS